DGLPVEWDRSILHAIVRIPGPKPLHVFNLHLRAPLAAVVGGQKETAFVWKSVAGWAEGYFIAAMKRAGQALEARLLIEDLFDDDPRALIAVCGDFNAEDYEVPVRILCADEEDTGNDRLAGRALFPVDRELARVRRYSVIHHGRPQMLDHLFASPALHARIEAVEVDNDDLGDEFLDFVEDRKTGRSHHAPLVATVRDET
ncbi:MAG: endonuclease, partial [Rhodospirillales bacterium]|nr:endonuclease [Rhodospirillales bacterium]